MCIKIGILPRKSKRVCSFTADLVERNNAHGKTPAEIYWGREVARKAA